MGTTEENNIGRSELVISDHELIVAGRALTPSEVVDEQLLASHMVAVERSKHLAAMLLTSSRPGTIKPVNLRAHIRSRRDPLRDFITKTLGPVDGLGHDLDLDASTSPDELVGIKVRVISTFVSEDSLYNSLDLT